MPRLAHHNAGGVAFHVLNRPGVGRRTPFHEDALCCRGVVRAFLAACSLLAWTCVSIGATAAAAPTPPKPFTPVEASTRQFKCLGRTTDLGDFLLPAQITARNKPMLAAPVRLFSEPASLIATAGGARARLVNHSADSATWEWSGDSPDFGLTGRLRADCDGLCWYEIRLEPRHPVKLRSLGLEIPRNAATAKYLHSANYTWSNVSQGLPEMGGKWSSAFVPYLWLGDEERGLAWFAESDEGWHLSNAGAALGVATRGDVVTVRATWLDHEETISAPLVMRFGLQASPVKPVSFVRRAQARILHDIHYESADLDADGRCELDRLREGGVKTVVIHDSWTRYFGQMVPADAARFRRLIDACHQRKLKLLVYVGYGIARTAPEIKGKHDEWSVLPLIPWDPQYKPETRGFDATCPHSGWADWLVAGTEKLFGEYDLDGLYFDGTSAAWTCRNAAHGCGWKDAQGQIHAVYPIMAARQLMRRMADTVHRHQPDAILDVHMSSNMTLPTLAFCDSAWNGEQFEGHTAGEKFQVPLHAFRTEFMGYAHGLDTEFLCYENRPFTFSEALALAWVHGVEVRPYPKTLAQVTPIWRALDRFDVATADWRPYWSDPPATADHDDVKISAWTRAGRALLFVSHLQRNSLTARIRLDRRRLNLQVKPGEVHARDALTAADIDVKENALELNFDGMSYRMIELTE